MLYHRHPWRRAADDLPSSTYTTSGCEYALTLWCCASVRRGRGRRGDQKTECDGHYSARGLAPLQIRDLRSHVGGEPSWRPGVFGQGAGCPQRAGLRSTAAPAPV